MFFPHPRENSESAGKIFWGGTYVISTTEEVIDAIEWIRDRDWRFLYHCLSETSFFFLGVWGVRKGIDPFVDHDALRKNVHQRPVAGTQTREHFGRSVLERATESLQQSRVGCDLGHTEIGDDDLEERIPFDQNVLGFKIAVDHPFCVEVLETIEYLSPNSHVFVVSGTGVGNFPKGIVIHDDGGLRGLPKLKHLYHIWLCGD